jgi:hypothetical protein
MAKWQIEILRCHHHHHPQSEMMTVRRRNSGCMTDAPREIAMALAFGLFPALKELPASPPLCAFRSVSVIVSRLKGCLGGAFALLPDAYEISFLSLHLYVSVFNIRTRF